jgi:hypothetical protein
VWVKDGDAVIIIKLCGACRSVKKFNMSIEQLNAEILYWKSETDKRKVQLGEYLLDDPCDVDDSLWQTLAAEEVAEARQRVVGDPEAAMALIMELVRDKHACMVSRLVV